MEEKRESEDMKLIHLFMFAEGFLGMPSDIGGWDNRMSSGKGWRRNCIIFGDLLEMAAERQVRLNQVVCYRVGVRLKQWI